MPVTEVHQRHGNEAATSNDLITEHLCLTEAQVGSGKSCQSSADGQSLEAHSVDLDADRVGSPGIGSYSSDPQSPGGLEEYVPSDRNKLKKIGPRMGIFESPGIGKLSMPGTDWVPPMK